jgi:hypothetical protein
LVAAESDEEAGRLATSAFQRHLNLLRGEPIFVPAPVDNMQKLYAQIFEIILRRARRRFREAVRKIGRFALSGRAERHARRESHLLRKPVCREIPTVYVSVFTVGKDRPGRGINRRRVDAPLLTPGPSSAGVGPKMVMISFITLTPVTGSVWTAFGSRIAIRFMLSPPASV